MVTCDTLLRRWTAAAADANAAVSALKFGAGLSVLDLPFLMPKPPLLPCLKPSIPPTNMPKSTRIHAECSILYLERPI